MDSTAPFVVPNTSSTLLFLGVVALVCGAWILALRRAWAQQRRAMGWGALVLGAVMGLSAALANSGVLSAGMNSPRAAIYFAVSNGLAVVLALSPVGKRFAAHLPVQWLVGVHAFRLPLELVLHSWYEQGTLPVQMTYVGENWDIVTGIAAALLIVCLPRVSAKMQYWLALGFTGLGLTLLLRVMSIAVRSTPWPWRTFFNDPPVLLAFYAPYTWIVPMCVSSALFAHVVALRWLWLNKPPSVSPSTRTPTPQHLQ